MTRASALISLTFVVCLVLTTAFPAKAQLDLSAITTADLSLTASTEYPAPNSSVRLSIKSFLLDLLSSDITWYANDSVVARGIGITEATVTTGAIGSETRVRVEVVGQEESASASAVLHPSEVDLLWEGDSYTPPFYKGRALASAGSTVRLFAVPRLRQGGSGAFIAPNSLIYTWRKNGKIVQSLSGLGKSTARIDAPLLSGADTISVEVKTVSGSLRGFASVTIPAATPTLVLYENHPVFGILYHQALLSPASVPETETSFSVVPYFAPVQNPNDGSLVYEWRVNNFRIASNPIQPSAVTINAEGTDGRALLALAVTHVTNFFLDVRNTWNITLSGTRSTVTTSPFTDPFSKPQ